MITRARVVAVLEALGVDAKVWVAGSAAILPEKADDIDLWVMKKSTIKVEDFNEEIWTPFDLGGYNAIPGIAARRQTTVPAIEGYTSPIKLQIMFTQFGNVCDLLANFDMSCHAWARNKDGFLVAHPKATFPGTPIKLLKDIEKPEVPECKDDDGKPCNGCQEIYDQDMKEWNVHQARLSTFTERYLTTKPEHCWIPQL